jgi:hypothetical protein
MAARVLQPGPVTFENKGFFIFAGRFTEKHSKGIADE